MEGTEVRMLARGRRGPVHHPRFARCFARLSETIEPGVAGYREELLAGLSGRVVEIGAGNGLNFRHYPATVAEVVAVEPEPYLRELAVAAAAEVAIPIQVVDGTAEALPAADAAFDAGVASLVLCSVYDQPRALSELHRVIRPGGELRFFEHVQAEGGALACVQRTADLVWPLLAGGCHTSRDTVGAVTAAGFELDSCRRLRFPDTRMPSPNSPHVLGAARRPPTG